jgi:flagellar basal-body rod protein FlgB
MAIADIPILAMLRTRMQWQQQRQQVLAQNVANADTPNYHPVELVDPKFQVANAGFAQLQLARDDPGQLAGLSDPTTFAGNRQQYEVRPAGNAVNLEDEMMKVAANQMDFQTATQLYTHSLSLIKLAADKS